MGTRATIYKVRKEIWDDYLNTDDKEKVENFLRDSDNICEILHTDFATDLFRDMAADGKIKRFSLIKASWECDVFQGILDKELFEVFIGYCRKRVSRLLDAIRENELCAKEHKRIFESGLYLKISEDKDTLLESTDTWFDCLYESLYIYKTMNWDNYVILYLIG